MTASLKASADGTQAIIQVGGVDKVTIGSTGIQQGSLATAIRPIGEGQTWQTVTRTSGATYTNSTGRPIMVAIATTYNNTSSGGFTMTVGGVSVINCLGNAGAIGMGQNATHTVVVPDNTTYVITGVISSVAELR